MKIIDKTIAMIENFAKFVIPAILCLVVVIGTLLLLGLFGSGILMFFGWLFSVIGKFLIIGLVVFVIFGILMAIFNN